MTPGVTNRTGLDNLRPSTSCVCDVEDIMKRGPLNVLVVAPQHGQTREWMVGSGIILRVA